MQLRDLPELDLPHGLFSCSIDTIQTAVPVNLPACRELMRTLARWDVVPGLTSVTRAADKSAIARDVLRLPGGGKLVISPPEASFFVLHAPGHERMFFMADNRLGFGFATSRDAYFRHNGDGAAMHYTVDGDSRQEYVATGHSPSGKFQFTALEMYGAALFCTVVRNARRDGVPQIHMLADCDEDDVWRITYSGDYATLALKHALARQGAATPQRLQQLREDEEGLYFDTALEDDTASMLFAACTSGVTGLLAALQDPDFAAAAGRDWGPCGDFLLDAVDDDAGDAAVDAAETEFFTTLPWSALFALRSSI
jgi:hypothetical protein